jgi:hypothetical protein
MAQLAKTRGIISKIRESHSQTLVLFLEKEDRRCK